LKELLNSIKIQQEQLRTNKYSIHKKIMEEDLGRIEAAKKKLRKELSYENLKKKEKYKNLTQPEYDQLIDNIEKMTFLILDVYFEENPDETPQNFY